jgi:hypothetical protein
MQGALLALHPSLLASPNAVEPSLSVFSRRIFHLQTIIMFYIVTACEDMPWVPLYRSSIRVVDVNALQQQRQLFDGNALQQQRQLFRRQRSPAAAPFV